MERVNAIINNSDYLKNMNDIRELEQNRKFCGHGSAHCMDVARIMMLLNEEETLNIEKEYIYATALLHDIGRGIQYREGISHEQAGVSIASDILNESGFSESEIRFIVQAIGQHRDAGIKGEHSLAGILYRADKLSRACYACEAEAECDWDQEKKNKVIQY